MKKHKLKNKEMISDRDIKKRLNNTKSTVKKDWIISAKKWSSAFSDKHDSDKEFNNWIYR